MWLASIIATIIRRVSSGHNGTNVWVEAHFPPWPNELLCVLCESVACSRLSLLYRKARKERRQERKAKLRTIALRPLRILGVLRGEVLLTAKLAPDCRQERKAKPTHQVKLSLYLSLY